MNDLVQNGELHLLGPVGFRDFDGEGFTVRDVTEALSSLEGDITVRINSGGGAAFDGIAIHSLLAQHDGDVTTVAQGIAASAASIIFMAGDNRVMAPGALLMVHDASGMTFGTEAVHMQTAGVLGKLSNSLASIYAAGTGHSIDNMRSVMMAETWLDGSEATKDGFATAETDTGEEPASAFDYQSYSNAPEILLKNSGNPEQGGQNIAASMVAAARQQPNEDAMSKPEIKAVEATAMTLTAFKADYPEMFAEVVASAANAERDRIKACLEVLGTATASDAVSALCFDGTSQAGDVALAVLAEARAKGKDHLADLATQEAKLADLKPAPVAVVDDTPENANTPEGWEAEYKASKELQGEFMSSADYVAFMVAETSGRVKVLHTNKGKS